MSIIDISHTLDGGTPVYPGDFDTSLTRHRTLEKDHYNAYLLQSCLHTGTHIDMPMHLLDDARTAADFPPGDFIAPGVLLDARGERPVRMRDAYRSLALEGRAVLILTGFGGRFRSPGYFTEYPPLEEALVDFLLESGIRLLGMDTPSPDYIPHTLHRRILGAGVCILENLTNLEVLADAERFEVIALPLKIAAEASLVRAVCRLLP